MDNQNVFLKSIVLELWQLLCFFVILHMVSEKV